ncbi:hypothetical protein PMZ80_003588 [Knufia obscura]|uniref:Heterokaryon incompatibility domain-containing protein n=1 Tax=Knufia obscura TaxID=1635080 RepID=A0ABR0RUN0_9EURO|nr:hypothetical protein PMZ80_003588 [Knufia obscura]
MTQNAPSATPIYDNLDTNNNTTTPQIRLLKVNPTLTNNRITCNLTTVPLHTAKSKYVVLSYRWGTTPATQPILLNGHLFLLRHNLWSFLDVIREQEGMMLWIDALCIDQGNVEERNSQVKVMGRIFQGASMVLSWLGVGNEAVEMAFEVMGRVWEGEDGDAESGSDMDLDSLPVVRGGPDEDELWRCVVEVCSLQYWGRVWVVQEILLSSNNYLLCGRRTLPWQVFANFLSLIDVRFRCPAQYGRVIHGSTARSYAMRKPYAMVRPELQWRIGRELRHDYGKAWDTEEYNLFRILTMFGERDCADPLDHIYALLSLSEEGDAFPIQYGVDKVGLFLTAIHFCGRSAAQEHHGASLQAHYRPASQRAFMRNARFLAETMEVIPAYQRTPPYFHGTAVSTRGPSPRPDPCFPCAYQILHLQCTTVVPGDEPPVLRSSSLQRTMGSIAFDTLLHLDETSSWLMCKKQEGQIDGLAVVAVITIKDGPRGRGFKILEPGRLAASVITHPGDGSGMGKWEMTIPADAHLDLLKITILSVQPG